MANSFGTDILLQAEDPKAAAAFYTEQLGFEVTSESDELIAIRGPHITLYIERGPAGAGPCSRSHRKKRSRSKETTRNRRLPDHQRQTAIPAHLHSRSLRPHLQPDKVASCAPQPALSLSKSPRFQAWDNTPASSPTTELIANS